VLASTDATQDDINLWAESLDYSMSLLEEKPVATPKSAEKELIGTDYMNAEYIAETNSLRIFEGMPVDGALSSIQVSEKATAHARCFCQCAQHG
jgi:hypothetical protein